VHVRRVVFLTILAYLALIGAAGILLCDGALHPMRRPLTSSDQAQGREMAERHHATLQDASISSGDKVTLHAWLLTPRNPNGNAVILLHGLSDNRIGMTGYAELMLEHHYAVLLPDARAHGASGGALATYGLLERNDIRQWFEWLTKHLQSACVYGLGESMGAAQLLQATGESHFCAVAAESPFSNFHEIAYDRVGQFIHTGPWLGRTLFRPVIELAFAYGRWKYDLDLSAVSPESTVAVTTTPILLIHGQKDGNIPVRHSERIAVRNPKIVLWEIPHTDHCGAISTAREEFESRVIAWFEEHRRPVPDCLTLSRPTAKC